MNCKRYNIFFFSRKTTFFGVFSFPSFFNLLASVGIYYTNTVVQLHANPLIFYGLSGVATYYLRKGRQLHPISRNI